MHSRLKADPWTVLDQTTIHRELQLSPLPDMNVCDFCFWGHHKDKVYIHMPHVLEALQIGILYINVENKKQELLNITGFVT
jgi:hypothetical protein